MRKILYSLICLFLVTNLYAGFRGGGDMYKKSTFDVLKSTQVKVNTIIPLSGSKIQLFNSLNQQLNIFHNANATGLDAIAIMPTSQCSGNDSVAVSRNANCSGNDSICLGYASQTNANYTVSIGYYCVNDTPYSVGIGIGHSGAGKLNILVIEDNLTFKTTCHFEKWIDLNNNEIKNVSTITVNGLVKSNTYTSQHGSTATWSVPLKWNDIGDGNHILFDGSGAGLSGSSDKYLYFDSQNYWQADGKVYTNAIYAYTTDSVVWVRLDGISGADDYARFSTNRNFNIETGTNFNLRFKPAGTGHSIAYVDYDTSFKTDGGEFEVNESTAQFTVDVIATDREIIAGTFTVTGQYEYPDGTSANSATVHQSTWSIGISTKPSTTSTTYVVLPSSMDSVGNIVSSMTVTMTTGANPVLVLFSGTFFNDTSAEAIYIILDIDGTKIDATERINVDTAYYRNCLTITHMETMSAGEHTFTIYWRVAGGTGYCQGIQRELQVIELKR